MFGGSKSTWRKKFPSFEEAKAYMNERGKTEYFGMNGLDDWYYVYSITVDGVKYHLDIYPDGRFELRLFGICKE